MNNSASKQMSLLTIGALGVVFGDIGTSPLYALRETLLPYSLTELNVLGVLSLIFWILTLLISLKYLTIILRADNNGEGGVLALLAMVKERNKKHMVLLLVLAAIGAGLLFGDGMLTPAISVLSAMEGLELISPKLNTTVIVPCTVLVLIFLFWQQRRGTAKIGGYFGPILALWFVIIGALGLIQIIENPSVLRALNPYYALHFFYIHWKTSFLVLGGAFLVLTGGEALYADLGHFGRKPIQLSWFFIVFPGIVLNYFGQGALLLKMPSAIDNPFYGLAPSWFLYPLVFFATAATIIASQAVISAAFSLASQAVLLNLVPRMRIIQTSAEVRGQVYVPLMNVLLAFGTVLLVVGFETSSKLAAIYGIAVNLVMLIVTMLVTIVARQIWKWSWIKMILLFFFVLVDFTFFAANIFKIENGGWIPLGIAIVSSMIMLTWFPRIRLVREIFYEHRPNLSDIIKSMRKSSRVHQIPELTAVFITDIADSSGGSFLHYLKLNHTLPGCVIILSTMVGDKPYVRDSERFEFSEITDGFYRLILHYGFMQLIDVPDAIEQIMKRGVFPVQFDHHDTTYFTESKQMVITHRPQKYLWYWQKKLFASLQNSSLPSIGFYRLPVNRTISIGVYCEI